VNLGLIEIYDRNNGSTVLRFWGRSHEWPYIQICGDKLSFLGYLHSDENDLNLTILDLKSGVEIWSLKKDWELRNFWPSKSLTEVFLRLNYILEKTRVLAHYEEHIYSAEFWI